MRPRTPKESAPSNEGEILAKAVVRAAKRLGLDQSDLVRILNVSAASVSRTWAEERPIAPKSNEGEKALLFLRIYRSLDSIVGGESDKAGAWFHAENRHLGGIPAQLVSDYNGLHRVAEYLDAMRGVL